MLRNLGMWAGSRTLQAACLVLLQSIDDGLDVPDRCDRQPVDSPRRAAMTAAGLRVPDTGQALLDTLRATDRQPSSPAATTLAWTVQQMTPGFPGGDGRERRHRRTTCPTHVGARRVIALGGATLASEVTRVVGSDGQRRPPSSGDLRPRRSADRRANVGF